MPKQTKKLPSDEILLLAKQYHREFACRGVEFKHCKDVHTHGFVAILSYLDKHLSDK